mmetsp:Transcript_17782/g.37498  ORF Transcript_17782/g.37498 Transcript_17782/m.37498 type:complete len:203 (+) Transcript_17782:2210-2818(+)
MSPTEKVLGKNRSFESWMDTSNFSRSPGEQFSIVWSSYCTRILEIVEEELDSDMTSATVPIYHSLWNSLNISGTSYNTLTSSPFLICKSSASVGATASFSNWASLFVSIDFPLSLIGMDDSSVTFDTSTSIVTTAASHESRTESPASSIVTSINSSDGGDSGAVGAESAFAVGDGVVPAIAIKSAVAAAAVIVAWLPGSLSP